MQGYPPHNNYPNPKDYSSNENQISKGDLTNSFTSNNTINNLQGIHIQTSSGYESRRKTRRNEEIGDSPGKEGSDCSMSYSPSNPTRTNTLSHRANSRNFNHNKKGAENNSKSIEILKTKDFRTEEGIMNTSDVNDSQMHDLDSKRDSVYMPLELAKYQIKSFEEEMKTIGDRHSRLVGDLEKNYKTLENETEQYYSDILEKWKEVVKEKILSYRRNYEDTLIERNRTIDELQVVISQLERQNAKLGQERETIVQKITNELQQTERKKEETLRNMNESYKDRIMELEKEREDLVQDIEAVEEKAKNMREKAMKDSQYLEGLNSSLKEDNTKMQSELKKIKNEFSKEVAAYALENICNQVEGQSTIQERDMIIQNNELMMEELNTTIDKLNAEMNVLQENYDVLKAESSDKYKVFEEKISQLKIMLHLEKPKNKSRSATPIDSAREKESKTPDQERSPNHERVSQRPVEEEKSRLDISATNLVPLQPLGPLIDQIEDLIKKKEKTDNQIKGWIQDFKRRENRYPTDVDKQPIKDLYKQHRVLKKQIETVKENITARDGVASTSMRDTSMMQIAEVDDRNIGKSRSMSPKKAQLQRLVSFQSSHANPNVSNVSINASFDATGMSHLNTSNNEQSFLQGTSFYHSSGIPMAASNDLAKLKNENRSLREELQLLRLQTASKFEESDAINNLKTEIQSLQRDKKFLKDKAISLTKNIKALQQQQNNDTSLIGISDEVERKSIDSERFRLKMDSDNKLKDMEKKYSMEMENLKQECKKQIADIIKAKDILISTTAQENQALKEENNKVSKELKNCIQEMNKSKTQLMEMKQEIEELKATKLHMEARIRSEVAQRKKLHNIVEDMKGKVRVFCRIRPLIKSETDRGCQIVAAQIDEFNLNLETEYGPKVFPYDSCFGPASTQDQIFEDSKRLIQSAVDGYNVCIFAYGQTGSGKTYTMYGSKEKPGITPRSIDELYHILAQMESFCEIRVSCHMLELYMDNLNDLLISKENKKNQPVLEIKEDIKGAVYVQNITSRHAATKEDLSKIIRAGMQNRKVGSTAMNEYSSRSHLIVNIVIEVFNKHTDQRTIGKLALVDLAGSERVSKANSTPKQLNEARAINKSLSALADVISALSSQVLGEKDKFVPYRNNKLTMLMKDCLGGTAKTLMFVNVSPADYNLKETQNSLCYATRAKLIVNETTKNVETKELSRIKEYMKTVVEERDFMKQLLSQSGISMTKSQLGSLNNTPSKSETDESKFDEGPSYQFSINENIKL